MFTLPIRFPACFSERSSHSDVQGGKPLHREVGEEKKLQRHHLPSSTGRKFNRRANRQPLPH